MSNRTCTDLHTCNVNPYCNIVLLRLPEDFLFQYQPICISQRAVPHLRSYSADEEVDAQKKLLDESLKKEMNKLSTS